MNNKEYIWSLKNGFPDTYKNVSVFDTFSCGGGSSMGAKLLGVNHLGGIEIDERVAKCYIENLKPKYFYNEDIRTFTEKDDLPEELYNLDILTGSPPCSSFSMIGSREAGWGKEKKFSEGQQLQRLDDLFFDWIDLVGKLKPKIAIAENVKGLIFGNAKAYVHLINENLKKHGYTTQLFLIKGGAIGLPQNRERVFFIARRNDLKLNPLKMDIKKTQQVLYKDIKDGTCGPELNGKERELWENRQSGDKTLADANNRLYGKKSFFGRSFLYDNKTPNTIVASSINLIKFDRPNYASQEELAKMSSFPSDYKYIGRPYYWYLGMSIPPLMMKKVLEQVLDQWFKKEN